MRVLWIDDEAWAIYPLMLPLSRGGAEVDIAQNYSDALERIAATRYDAYIVDLVLPYGGDGHPPEKQLHNQILGLSLVREIKARYSDAAIIVLSVVLTSEMRETLLGYGVKHAIAKPCLPSKLKEILVDVLSL